MTGMIAFTFVFGAAVGLLISTLLVVVAVEDWEIGGHMRERHWLPWEDHGDGYEVADNQGRRAITYLADRIYECGGKDRDHAEESLYRLVGYLCMNGDGE